MDDWEYLKSITNSRRRKALIKAYHLRCERGEPHPQFAVFNMFTKDEKEAYFGQYRGDYAPQWKRTVSRLICAPHDETHISAGKYLKPLIPRLKDCWHWDNWIFYASVEPYKLDKWLQKHCAAASWFWSDYSAFDATYSPQAWAMLESAYRIIYPHAEQEFWQVLEIWRRPHGKKRMKQEDITIEYTGNVCNASGRDDTALANALLNGLVLAMSFASALCGKQVEDVTEEDLRHASEHFNIAIVGDDSLVACDMVIDPYVRAIETGIRAFGLVAVVQHSISLVDVTFLGMMPYMVRGSYYWGPTIGRRLYKAFWQLDPTGKQHLPAWTRGVAQQLGKYRNVPVMSDLAVKIDQLLTGHVVTRVSRDENRPWTMIEDTLPQWDDSTIDWLCARYPGLTPTLVREDLITIRRIERLPAVVFLWTAQFALAADDM